MFWLLNNLKSAEKFIREFERSLAKAKQFGKDCEERRFGNYLTRKGRKKRSIDTDRSAMATMWLLPEGAEEFASDSGRYAANVIAFKKDYLVERFREDRTLNRGRARSFGAETSPKRPRYSKA